MTLPNPACKFSEAARPACKQSRADLSYRLPVVLAFQFFAPFVALVIHAPEWTRERVESDRIFGGEIRNVEC